MKLHEVATYSPYWKSIAHMGLSHRKKERAIHFRFVIPLTLVFFELVKRIIWTINIMNIFSL